jgi:beta-lactamase class A
VAALSAPVIARPGQTGAVSRLAELERRSGGRLGVCVLDARGRHVVAYRADERFPICSTFKVLLVSLVLERYDAGTLQLDDDIHYGKSDLIEHAPVTSANVVRGFMTVEGLCQAAIEQSDNTAANLLLRTVGGPAAVTRFARSIGDSKTRLDRGEPALNSAIPGDPRDTTTPSAMAADLRTLLAGTALSRASRERLAGWMVDCRTGTDAIRAGVPKSWRAGDKTGSGDHGTRNDVAFLRPPSQLTLYVTAYLTGATVSQSARNTVLASVGSVASAAAG